MDIEQFQELLQEEWDSGGITLICPDCGSVSFVELDAEGWCEECKKPIKNPFLEAGLI